MEAKALAIVETLQGAGHTALFAGGFVRDRLLGRDPHDVDVVTSATPDEVEALFERTEDVGRSFGVVLVVLDGEPFEVATFRSDSADSDGRRPESVRFTTPEEDARRRDFTVNALFLDPVTDEVHDFVGGRKDLEAGRLRTVGDPRARFAEDHLRMLRAVRFATTLGFELDAAVADAVRGMAHLVVGVSGERVRDELAAMLTGPAPRRAVEMLDDLGLLGHVLPEVEALKGIAQPPEFHPEGDVFVHTLKVLDNLPEAPEVEIVFAALLHDLGKPAAQGLDGGRITFHGHEKVSVELAETVLRRLRFPTRTQEKVLFLVANHMRFRSVMDMGEAKLRRFVRHEHFDALMEVHRADALGGSGDLSKHAFLSGKAREFEAEPGRFRPERLVTGHDLKAMGLAPGPRFRVLLERVEDAQLEGRVRTRAEALAFLGELL